MAIGNYYNTCVKFTPEGNPLPYSQKIVVDTDSNGTDILATPNVPLAQRRDANTTIATANGDFAQLQLDSTGRLKVAIDGSVSSGGGLTDTQLRASPVPISGNVVVTQPTGTNLHTVVDSGSVTATISGTPNVAVTSSVLPTGAATSANQTTANTSLNSIDTKLPTAAALADNTTNPSTLTFGSDLSNFNGTSWDRARNITGATSDTGILATAEYIPTSINATASFASSTVLSSSIIAKASSGNLYELVGYSTTAGFIQIFNSATVPADGAVPIISFAIEANNNFSKTLPKPIRFSNGIVACFSTTQTTKTIGGNVAWFEVTFK